MNSDSKVSCRELFKKIKYPPPLFSIYILHTTVCCSEQGFIQNKF